VFLEFIGRDGNLKGTPLDVDPVFHKDFLFYGIDPDVRQKLMDELKGGEADDAEAGSKRKRQAKGRTNFEISATAIRSKYSKHGNQPFQCRGYHFYRQIIDEALTFPLLSKCKVD